MTPRMFTTGADVWAARKRLGWTQEQLAEALGVTSRTVSAWERGENSPPPSVRFQLAELERENGRKEA